MVDGVISVLDMSSPMRASDYADLHALEAHFWWFEGMRAITAAILDPVCPAGRDRAILDAGCGAGGNLSWLGRYAGTGPVVGIDLAPIALGLSRERHRKLGQASVTALPFAGETFDLVTSFDVLSQLPGPGGTDALREVHRTLRPGGVAFIRVAAYPWMRSGHDIALTVRRRYSLAELTAEVGRAGLHVVRATYANSALLPVAVIRRLILPRVGLVAPGSDVRPLPRRLRGLNRALTGVLRAEARFLGRPGARLPAGLSAICLAAREAR